MGALGIISLITALIPLVSAGIDLAEKLFGAKKGQGPIKKEAVISSLGTAWDNAQGQGILGKDLKGVQSKDIAPLASMLIDLFVGISNAAGVYKPLTPEEEKALTSG